MILDLQLELNFTRYSTQSIASDFGIGTYTAKNDFDDHFKTAVFEGINPSDSFVEFSEKTAIHDELTYTAGSTFSRLTNNRDYHSSLVKTHTSVS